MKRGLLILALGIVAVMFIFSGCSNPSEAIDPPRSLTLTATTDEVGLILSWSASSTSDIDGYRIYLNDVQLTEVETGTTTYTDADPSELGEYKVVAYRGSEESDPTTASSDVVTGTGTIWVSTDPSPDHPSAFGWSSTGVGSSHSLQETYWEDIDIYLDGADNNLTDPSYLVDSGSWTNANETGVIEVTGGDFDNDTVLPTTGYTQGAEVGEGQVYGLYAMRTGTVGNYIMLRADTFGGDGQLTFTYKYQKIQGFARVK